MVPRLSTARGFGALAHACFLILFFLFFSRARARSARKASTGAGFLAIWGCRELSLFSG